MNKIDLAGRAGVVTGAARGIGLAIAERLLQSGGVVALWDLDRDALADAQRNLAAHGRVGAEVVDVTREADVERASRAALEQFGRIDLLVNNAGIGGPICQTW